MITIYKKVWDKEPFGHLNLKDIILYIKNGKYKDLVEDCVRYADKSDKKKYSSLKLKLPVFTPSGMFKKDRKTKHLEKYSGYIIIDIDNLSSVTEANRIKKESASFPWVRVAFLSPSRVGVKIIVRVNSDHTEHKEAYKVLSDHFSHVLRVQIDKSGSDVTRACFFSYDADIVENFNEESFDYKMYNISNNITENMEVDKIFAETIVFTEKVDSFKPGNRNTFVFVLANNLNRRGVPESNALNMIVGKYQESDFSTKEISNIIKSAYKNNSEHGKYQSLDSGNHQEKIDKTILQKVLKKHSATYSSIDDLFFLSVLLHSSTNDDSSSLYEFCLQFRDYLDFDILSTEYRDAIKCAFSKDTIENRNYWLDNKDESIQNLSKRIFSNKLNDDNGLLRLKISIYFRETLHKIIIKRAIKIRYTPMDAVKQKITEIEYLTEKMTQIEGDIRLLANTLYKQDFSL